MPENTKKITGEVKISPERFNLFQKEIKNISSFKKVLEKYLIKNATEILEVILGGTISLSGSDIHIEPEEKKVKLRIRIDGILLDVIFINPQTYKLLLSRIKLLSGIKLNITDRPQDGRFSIIIPNKKKEVKPLLIEIRTSSLPTEYGEGLVMRVLNPKSLIDLEKLGLREDLLTLFKKEIKKPNGMIIVTGPTGSGKTTTLYAFLKKIKNPKIKIITIEDPIEYRLEGMSQTQIAPEKGYDFASGLRAIVRQDPDVILVGEIRDSETVNIALQAALTGHLVFSTIHTNNAVGTIPRLTNLGARLFDIGPAINMVIAQRLVRKVCPKCRKLEKIPPHFLKKIKTSLRKIPSRIKIPKIGPNTRIPRAVGCSECNFTGYKGRIGIYEAFLVDAKMEKFILKKPSVAQLKEKAIKNGMVPMYEDGLIKVLEGITTISEIERVALSEE